MLNVKALSLTDFIKKICPFILTIVIMSSFFYAYTGEYINIYVVISAVYSLFMFVFFNFAEKRRKLAPLFIIPFMILVMIMAIREFRSDWGRAFDFFRWFALGSDLVEIRDSYLNIILISFSFFFSATIYYFSQIIYRPAYLALITLIPCAVFVKLIVALPPVYVIILGACNFLIYLLHDHMRDAKKIRTAGVKQAVMVFADFAVATILLAAIIPKPDYTPFYDKFESFVLKYSIGSQSGGVSGDYGDFSGNADGMLQMEDRLLYMMNTTRPSYLKIQTFDYYNYETDRWINSGGGINGYPRWEDGRAALNYASLAEAYRSAYDFSSGAAVNEALSGLPADDEIYSASLRAFNYSAVFVISPLRVTAVNLDSRTTASVSYRAENGEIFTDAEVLSPNAAYGLEYYSDNFIKESGWIASGGCDMTFDEYGALLNAVNEELRRNGGENALINTVSEFISEHERASRFRSYNYRAPSDRITRLSDEITSNLVYDWQKAEALANYFSEQGFEYDLEYRAPRNLNDRTEFFIFESKTGTCSDFANAFCHLARAAGLIVRYAEGFVPEVTPDRGVYHVYTSNAHAYPEVYIPGAGWTLYEPTVMGSDVFNRRNAQNGQNAGETDYIAAFIASLSALGGLTALLLLAVFAPKIAEALFRLSVWRADEKTAVCLIYNRHITLLKRKYNENADSLTPDQITEYAGNLTGIDITPISRPFTYGFYGNAQVSKEEKRAAWECYKLHYKLLNKRQKRNAANIAGNASRPFRQRKKA